MAESCKTMTIVRRLALGIYQQWDSPILDVGAGPATPSYDWAARVRARGGPDLEVHRFDLEHGDAQTLAGVGDSSYPTVYASHVLEHLREPVEALVNWVRVCTVGGTVFVAVPHRNLYECGKPSPPSAWAGDQHLWFFEPDRRTGPRVLGLAELLLVTLPQALAPRGMEVRLKYLATCDWGYERPVSGHPRGEYQIEAALVRLK
jgi:hypothetical protein